MDFWLSFLPVIIYILLIILLIVGIILGIKSIITVNKVEKVVDDVSEKVESLNGLFQIVASKIFFRKKVKKVKEEENE